VAQDYPASSETSGNDPQAPETDFEEKQAAELSHQGQPGPKRRRNRASRSRDDAEGAGVGEGAGNDAEPADAVDEDLAALSAELERLRNDLDKCVAVVSSIARRRGGELRARTIAMVKDRPVSTAIGTFSVGMFLGLLMQSRAQPRRLDPSSYYH
jgi:hypothetical protein